MNGFELTIYVNLGFIVKDNSEDKQIQRIQANREYNPLFSSWIFYQGVLFRVLNRENPRNKPYKCTNYELE